MVRITLLVWTFLLACHSLAIDKVTVATTEYSPFTDSAAIHGGFVNRVIREAFARKGIAVEFKYLPWKRAVVMSTEAKYDALSFTFENAERELDFFFSDQLSDHSEVFFIKKGTNIPDWENLSDLSEYDFGATRAYTYTDEFSSLVKMGTLKATEVPDDLTNFKKLAAGRIDIFPMDEITGWSIVNKELPTLKHTLETLEKPLRATKGFLCFPRKAAQSEALLKIFNEGLETIKDDGTYQRFYNELLSGIY